jgi:addiction module RelB/DinJ family antitoxin
MATIQLRSRIDLDLKRKSASVLKSIGLDETSFITMALTQLVNRRGLPFAVTEPDDAYFASEYGLSRPEMSKAGIRMKREAANARKAGQLREINSVADLTA